MQIDLSIYYTIAIVTFVLTLPFDVLYLYKYLQAKFQFNKQQAMQTVNISKILINSVSSLLIQNKINKDKVKPLSDIILKSINYIVDTNADTSEDIKLNEGVELVKEISYELGINLNDSELGIIREVIRIVLKIYDNVK